MMLGKYIEDTKVVFENVSIVKIPTIPKNRCLVLTVVIHIATQTFEVRIIPSTISHRDIANLCLTDCRRWCYIYKG